MITIKCTSIRNKTIATITIIATSIICNVESQTVKSLKGGTAELLIGVGYLRPVCRYKIKYKQRNILKLVR